MNQRQFEQQAQRRRLAAALIEIQRFHELYNSAISRLSELRDQLDILTAPGVLASLEILCTPGQAPADIQCAARHIRDTFVIR